MTRRTVLLIVGIVALCAVVAVVTALLVRPPVGAPVPATPVAGATPSASASSTPSAQPEPVPTQDETNPEDELTPPEQATLEDYEAALQSGNTAALDPRLAPEVDVTLAGSECCGVLGRVDTINQLASVEPGSGATWSFGLTEVALEQYRDNEYYGQFFPANAIVGQSSDGYLVSFIPRYDGLVDTVFLGHTLDFG